MRHKLDETEWFEQLFMDLRARGVRSMAIARRPDGGGEFHGGNFGNLCRSRGIKQESTAADRPKISRVAPRALGLIEMAVMTGRVQPCGLFLGAKLPATASLWAEVPRWACDSENRAATAVNP